MQPIPARARTEVDALRAELRRLEQLRRQEARATRDATALFDALAAMSRCDGWEAALSALLLAAAEAMDATAACLLRRRGGLWAVDQATEGPLHGTMVSDATDLLAGAGRIPHLAEAGGLSADERFARFASLVWAPVALPGGERAALLCLSERPKAFGADDQRLLERMAQLPATALGAVGQAERRALLAAVIEGSTASISIADARSADTPLIYVNPAFTRLSGHDPDAVLARNCRLLAADPPDAPERVRLRHAVAERRRGRFLLRNRRKDGSLFWNELDLDPLPEEGPAARYLVATQMDVTEAVENRRVLETMNARLSDIAAVSDTWFWEFDADMRWTFLSEAVERILQVKRSDMIGRTLPETLAAVPELRLGGDWEGHFRTIAAREPIRGFTFRPLGLLDREAAIQINGRPFTGPDGRHGGYRGVASEVTDIIVARDTAERASRAKDEFLAAMSHELRTPLTAILGNIDLLADRAATPEDRARIAEIGAAGAMLDTRLSDVLDLARLEAGRMVLESGPVVPSDVVARAAAAHRRAAADKGLGFEVALSGPADLPRQGDGRRLVQLLHHILSNAVKFTPAGGVLLSLDARAPDRLMVEVTDTGIGVDPDNCTRVFDSFVQLDAGSGRAFGGAGIGLAIVRQLVALMGGEVRLDGVPGQGTTVWLSLPLPACREGETPPRETVAPPLTGLSVLVADDTAANRKILSAMLRRLGATVQLCADGDEALAAWRGGTHHLALVDINMPGMDGVALIRAIRNAEAATGAVRLPAIAVTANCHPDQVAVYRDAGFDDCVGKPFGLMQLADAIAAVLAAGPAQAAN